MLAHARLDERRRPWRRENPVADFPDQPTPYYARDGNDLLALVATLPVGRRRRSSRRSSLSTHRPGEPDPHPAG
jgi:hypothetical protein